MKKNIAMRVAAFLFILTMISTCAFATTFAKYTTSKSADDTARVAKFGVVINATGDDAMFKSVYDTTVNANGTKVVAPGTKVDNAVTFTVTGTPEVSVKLTYTVTLTLEGWEIDYNNGITNVSDEEYCPLVFKVTIGTTTKSYKIGTGTGEYTNIAALKTALESDINGLTNTYGPNHNLAENNANDVKISWEWAFNDIDVAGAYQQNIKDTALGDNAANGTPARVTLSLSCSVEQID